MKFSEDCLEVSKKWWDASFEHPFVKGIGTGELELEKFRHYVLQDSYYLTQFAKVQSYGAALSKDLFVTNRMAHHAQGTYEAEMGLHRRFSDLLGITSEDREKFQPAPTAYAYTSHLYRAVLSGNLGYVIAALLPCYWLYLEIGSHLKESTPDEPIYQEWINTYNGDWFKSLVTEQVDRLDELAENATEEEHADMLELFRISTYYEYCFWDMSYTLQDWGIKVSDEVQV
ncbi:thiaminase II [Bacillus sp. FSL K6-3431]|uniref:thiaminase II n=1 Tax=Bacillus sp. FSL K6-3431 TaxID=2921500 RepID=UPI0030FBA006